MANALATHSNEGKIQRGLEHLGCAARNFVLIANTVGLTRFMEGMNGVPGRHFSDAVAERIPTGTRHCTAAQQPADRFALPGIEVPLGGLVPTAADLVEDDGQQPRR